ncbi:MAG: glycosyltransferase family 4 protein [Gemmatimonadota bacterium]
MRATSASAKVEGAGSEVRPPTRRRFRILVINWQDGANPNAGGAEVHLHEIFGRLAGRGHRVSLLASGWPGCPRRAEAGGVRVYRVGRRHTFPLVVRRAYRRWLRASPFDVVVEDINKLPLFAPSWIRRPVVALVPHLFGTTAFREVSWPVAATVWGAERLMRRIYRGVPFQAISESTAEDLVRRGFSPERIRVIYPGVDHEVYCPDRAVSAFERPTAVYVGRLKRYKGVDILLHALRILKGRGIEFRLLVAGRGDDAGRLEKVARELEVDSRVTFLGYIPEERKLELLRRAWIHVYPSPKEGWGLTNVEAAACGTPSLASDAPGLRESVQDGVSGHLVPHRNARAWADRLQELREDASLRRRLGIGALRHASRFSWERAAEETERSLAEVIPGGTEG